MPKKIALEFTWDELMLLVSGLQDRISWFVPAGRMSPEMDLYVDQMEDLKERITNEANKMVDEQ